MNPSRPNPARPTAVPLQPAALLLGEFRRVLDDRHRLSIPPELLAAWPTDEPLSERESEQRREAAAQNATDAMTDADAAGRDGRVARSPHPQDATDDVPPTMRPNYVLAKERPGCVSLWRASDWQERMELGIRVVESKLQAGRLGDRMAQLQKLGRLLSTRHREVQLAGRGRLVIPEGFREFLGAPAGSELMVVGAAVCIEIWRVDAWLDCLNEQIPQFGEILDELSG